MEEFTQKEQYWIDRLLKGEEVLDACKDSRRDSWVVDGYLDYIDFLIKYGNLRIPTEEYVRCPRVIRVNKVIPKEILSAGNYYYTIFNGVYIVQDVIFVRAEHCEALRSRQLNDNENLKEEEVLLSSFQEIMYENGERWCIFLCKSRFTHDWIGYKSIWEFPYIYDDECI